MINDINLFKAESSIYLKKVSSKSEVSREDNSDGYLLDADEKECRKIVESLKGSKKIIGVYGRDNEFNRRALETLRINYLVSPERGIKKDSLKQRDSGLNHVLAKEAAKKNVSIIIDFNDINNLSGKNKARRMSRIMQNLVICRKAKCKILTCSLGSNIVEIVGIKERQAFGTSIGMSSVQSVNSTKI